LHKHGRKTHDVHFGFRAYASGAEGKGYGVIATQDLLDLDLASIALLAREETADEPSIPGLYDFSEVAAIAAVPQKKAAARGSRSAIVRGLRVMVQSRTLACSLVETFEQSQRLAPAS
jgi:hypothetical protein